LIRAVIDTNILIRAIIKPQGTVGPVVAALQSGLFQIVLSKPLLDELTAKLILPRIQNKYSLADEDIVDYLTFLAFHAHMVEPKEAVPVCRDPKDNMVLEAALAGQAAFIVTGDEDLLVLNPFGDVQIVTPSAFLRALQSG
jgi:putative PIN family toxin of toxin-antitoxin system